MFPEVRRADEVAFLDFEDGASLLDFNVVLVNAFGIPDDSGFEIDAEASSTSGADVNSSFSFAAFSLIKILSAIFLTFSGSVLPSQ